MGPVRVARALLLGVLVGAGLGSEAAEPPGDDFDEVVAESTAAREAGDLEQALEGFTRALALRPEWTEGQWAVATLLYDLDRFAEARAHFQSYVDGHPEDSLALALKGLCESRLGLQEAALTDLQAALRIGIPHAAVASAARLDAALLVNRLGNPDAALNLLRDFAIRGEDQIPVIQAFGLALLRLPLLPSEVPEEKRDMILLAGRGAYRMNRARRTPTGRLALEELVSRFPAEPNVHYALGLYLQPEEPDRAAREFRRELELWPENYVAMLQLASMELRRGNLDTALEMAERSYELAPQSPATHLLLGRALLETGDASRALELLESGARMAPESAEFPYALARAYRRAGRREEAARADARFRELKAPEEPQPDPGGTAR